MHIVYHYRDQRLHDFLVKVEFRGRLDAAGNESALECWTADKLTYGELKLQISGDSLHVNWSWLALLGNRTYLPGEVTLHKGNLYDRPSH
jgi:hypothetical protein